MNERFMQNAIDLALQQIRDGRGGPFGAVIVKDGQVLSWGANAVTSANDPTAHAEIVAIREACRVLGTFQLGGCELYTSCEPCPMCLSAIYWARIDRIYFAATRQDAAAAGFDDEFLYQELPRPVGERRLPTRQLLRDQACKVFAEWQAKPDKIPY